jgi:hypothetical protein
MANKKIEYEDDKVYRKNIDLSGKTIKALEKLAKLESRDLKPFIELKLIEISKNKKNESKHK